MHESPPILDYATPELGRRPPSIVMYQVAMFLSIVAAVVGVACFVGYATSRLDWFIMLGVFWLAIGGLMTAVAFVVGVVYAYRAARARFAGDAKRRRAVLAVCLPVANVALAMILTVAGTMAIFDPAARTKTPAAASFTAIDLSVTNPTSQPADVSVVDTDRKATRLGAVEAGALRTFHVAVGTADGTVNVEVRQGGLVWEQNAVGYAWAGRVSDPDVRVTLRVPATQPEIARPEHLPTSRP